MSIFRNITSKTREMKHFFSYIPLLFNPLKIHVQANIYTRCYQVRNIFLSKSLAHGEYEWQDPKSEDEVVNITYVKPNGDKVKVRGKVGDNVLYLAHRHNIEMEGACEASLACTTCHIYVDETSYSKLPEPSEEEEDLLDIAPFLKENSRLGCQIILTKENEGMELSLPQATRNFYVDGHKPKPH